MDKLKTSEQKGRIMQPIITRRSDGEYSTVTLPDGSIETVWFPDDPAEPARAVGRTYPRSVARIAAEHIAAYEKRGWSV